MPGSIRDDAARLLAARGLTEAELRDRLARLGHAPVEIEAAVREALHARWIDDAALCRALVQQGLARGRGKERILAQLLSRGIVPETAEAAWEGLLSSGDVDPESSLRDEVERRVKAAGGPLTGRAAARIYNALLRSGHDPESARSALAPYFRGNLGDDDDFP
ncbi:MAG TPA: regulatory protein RecX [Candidatus Polarisedimenticolaceae bacterium]|nr:regulatory protein RecX [Candidatus Polarisedimenticolaceae bacterium]